MSTAMFPPVSLVRHVATGAVYRIISGPDHTRIEAGAVPAYGYCAECAKPADEQVEGRCVEWIRPQSEMEDGRFVRAEE